MPTLTVFPRNRWDMTLADLHAKFLGSLQAERNASGETLSNYRSDFQKFVTYLSERKKRAELRAFTPDLLRDYQIVLATQEDRHRRKRSPNTVNRHLASLSSFGHWLVRWNYLPANPLDKLIRARRVRRLPQILSLDELRCLLALPLTHMEAAIRAVFCYAGLRRGEVIGLDWRQVDLEGEYLRVRGKGGHERAIGLTPWVKVALVDYLLAIGPQSPLQPVFTGSQGKRMHRHVLNALVKRWGLHIGRPDLHPHLLRSTFATYLAEGRDLAHVQDILGHREPATTRLYVQSRPAQLQETMQTFCYGIEQERQD